MNQSTVYPLAFACKHKDITIRMASRSGGVFTAVSDLILKDKGVIYGCALNEQLEAEHRRAETSEERDALRKSKYIQSDMGNCFQLVKQDLDNALIVLFSGTPCQVAGLQRYLSLTNTNTENLLTMDLICHGVPSPKLWRDYLAYQTKKHGKVLEAEFRNKEKFGWREHWETLTCEKGVVDSEIFKTLFYSNYPLRRSCHECPYASRNRIGDITLGDFWGIDNLLPGFNDDKGVSLIFVNSDKGKSYFDRAAEAGQLDIKQVNASKVNQKTLNGPYQYDAETENFWKLYHEKGIEAVIRQYTDHYRFLPKIKKTIKRFL